MNYLDGAKRRGGAAPVFTKPMKEHDLLKPAEPAMPTGPKYPTQASGAMGVARRRSMARQSR